MTMTKAELRHLRNGATRNNDPVPPSDSPHCDYCGHADPAGLQPSDDMYLHLNEGGTAAQWDDQRRQCADSAACLKRRAQRFPPRPLDGHPLKAIIDQAGREHEVHDAALAMVETFTREVAQLVNIGAEGTGLDELALSIGPLPAPEYPIHFDPEFPHVVPAQPPAPPLARGPGKPRRRVRGLTTPTQAARARREQARRQRQRRRSG